MDAKIFPFKLIKLINACPMGMQSFYGSVVPDGLLSTPLK
jgi:hypothetical protein